MHLINGLLVIFMSLTEFIWCQKELPNNLSKELYCAGCEETVHALDELLNERNNEAYDLRVLEALTMICDKQTFIESDYSPYYMQLACDTLLETHESVLEPYLVSHYSRIQRNTLNELIQQICHSISSACSNISRNKMEKLKRFHISEDGNININQEEWKTPQPVKESHKEL